MGGCSMEFLIGYGGLQRKKLVRQLERVAVSSN
jgi:hypothetical protein